MLSLRIAKPSPVVAFVAPFVVYVLLTMVESRGWAGLPYEFVCTLKGALAAGFDVGAVEIGADGMIRIVRNTEKAKNSSDPFDQWKASRDAR